MIGWPACGTSASVVKIRTVAAQPPVGLRTNADSANPISAAICCIASVESVSLRSSTTSSWLPLMGRPVVKTSRMWKGRPSGGEARVAGEAAGGGEAAAGGEARVAGGSSSEAAGGADGDGKWPCQTALQAVRSATARASASTRGALVGSHSARYSLSPLGQRLMTAMYRSTRQKPPLNSHGAPAIARSRRSHRSRHLAFASALVASAVPGDASKRSG
mmetsp:Transcript_49692/g.159987  ORF Transcript_49692/g.159987 Transcript_49692/m.159987 type:complete len:218 (-) Transcript_49692:405-1058(-)